MAVCDYNHRHDVREKVSSGEGEKGQQNTRADNVLRNIRKIKEIHSIEVELLLPILEYGLHL